MISSSSKDSRAVVTVDENFRVVRMIDASFEKTVPAGNAIFTGIHVINPSLLEYIPENIFTSITSYVYKRMVQQKEHINAIIIDGRWWDVGTPDDYLSCTFELLKSLPLHYFDPFDKYLLRPEKLNHEMLVVMGKNVKIPAISLNPPLIVGDGADLEKADKAGPNLVLGDKVKISKGTDTANAVYLNGSDGSRVLFGKKGKIYY